MSEGDEEVPERGGRGYRERGWGGSLMGAKRDLR